jgi:hypothetical protein
VPLPALSPNESALFIERKSRTTQLEAVCDNCSDVTLGSDTGQDSNLATLTNSSRLGARFNGDQCSVCHQQPAIGGSGGFLVPNPQDPANQFRKPENPMFDLIPHRKGGQNVVPSFITQYGPIREVRFQRKPDGTVDGCVHQLFTIVGRSDVGAPGCTAAVLSQPDFETEFRKGNLSFRIPLQMFGLGLIESIQDQTILSNAAATALGLDSPTPVMPRWAAGRPREIHHGSSGRLQVWRAERGSATLAAGGRLGGELV